MSINVTRVTRTIKVEHIDRTFNVVVRPKTFNIHAGGRRGVKGDDGQGVISGGSTGQTLMKASDTDFDMQWSNVGAGDMTKSKYDPTNVDADAFAMDNMSQGSTNKFVSPTDITKLANTSGVNSGDQDLSNVATSSALTAHTTNTSNPHLVTKAQVGLGNVPDTDLTAEVNANTLKVGITTQQADDITANNSKIGITPQQSSDITTNNAKVGITPTQASNILSNNAKVSYTDASDVSANTSARHSHANKGLLDTYTQTNANIADAVSKKHDPVDISGKQDTITVGTTAPSSPTTGQLWVDTN